MDEHLNWKTHVDHISNECWKTLGVLNKFKHVLPINVKIILYSSLILPHLNYGIMACGGIIKLQKKAIRMIS